MTKLRLSGSLSLVVIRVVTSAVVKVLSAFLLLLPVQAMSSSSINFALLVVNGEQRSAFLEQVRKFERHYPSIKVNIQGVEQETYKASFEGWLKAEAHSDVMFWFGGERLNWYVHQGLIEPVDMLWQRYKWADKITPAGRSAAQVAGRLYGLPIHYYNWGIYYNKRVFDQHGLQVPLTWEDFLLVCKKLKAAGVAPLALGSKEVWPVAAWFDYLNLRLNGLAFHQQLVQGEISYHDPRIKAVFRYLGDLVEAGYFMDDHQEHGWRSALPFLYRNLAGMVLMGNFWTSQIPESIKPNISLFPFPVIDQSLPLFEEAPTDLLVIPSNVKNRRDAEVFLNFMSDEKVQADLNDKLGMLAPQKDSRQKKDHFLEIAAAYLQQAQGLSQYYDRDNPQPIALQGMMQIQRFMLNPSELPMVLDELERLRKVSF